MTHQQQIQTAQKIPAQASSKARFNSQKQTGYMSKSYGDMALIGIGYTVYGWRGMADEIHASCYCGYSVKPVARLSLFNADELVELDYALANLMQDKTDYCAKRRRQCRTHRTSGSLACQGCRPDCPLIVENTMKTLRVIVLPLLLAVLSGCATNGGPYYYGGTGYRMHNIGGLPVSGSLGINVTPLGLMINPNIVIRPSYVDLRK